MASRLFGYNSGAPVSGAVQSGNLAVSNDFKAGGSVQWWNGPNEDLGYVIGYPDTTGNRKANGSLIGGNSVGFVRTSTKTDVEFLSLANSLTGQNFLTASTATSWLNTNGYYTSYFFYTEVPSDFYISTLVNSSELLYYTDNYYRIDLESFLSSGINIRNSNEIVRDGSDFYLCGNFGPSDTYFVKLTNCRLKNGLYLNFDSIEYNLITSYINYVHGMCFYKGYLYLSSRSTDVGVSTTVAKINSTNISEVTTLTLSSTYANKQATDIIAYKDNLYILPSNNSSGILVKIDLNLATYSALITTGTSSSPSRRVRTQSAFLIYNDEVFIPIVNNTSTGINQIGMQVWDLNGIIKRQIYNQVVNVEGTLSTGLIVPLPHWMGVYDNKLIISNAIMGTTTSHRGLVRMNIDTLAVEESIAMDTLVTDDNTIFSDGYIYLNGEAPSYAYYTNSWDINPGVTFSPKAKLVKIKYNNFTDKTDLISDIGSGSYGSLNPTSYII